MYLPEEMKLYRMRSEESMEVQVLPAGHHYVEAELDQVLIFIRPDHVAPLAKGGCHVEEVDVSCLRLLHFIKTEAVYELYDDDGYRKITDWEQSVTKITVAVNGEVTASGSKTGTYVLI